jgi:hypothetical protein
MKCVTQSRTEREARVSTVSAMLTLMCVLSNLDLINVMNQKISKER